MYPGHPSLLEDKVAELRPWRWVGWNWRSDITSQFRQQIVTGWKTWRLGLGAVTRAGSPFAHTFTVYRVLTLPRHCVFEH